jgi:hypothetical protein
MWNLNEIGIQVDQQPNARVLAKHETHEEVYNASFLSLGNGSWQIFAYLLHF